MYGAKKASRLERCVHAVPCDGLALTETQCPAEYLPSCGCGDPLCARGRRGDERVEEAGELRISRAAYHEQRITSTA